MATFLTNLNRRQGKRKALTASHRERHAETVHRLRKGENNEEHGSLVWLLHSKRLNPRTGAEQNVCTAASATWILLNSVQQNWTSRLDNASAHIHALHSHVHSFTERTNHITHRTSRQLPQRLTDVPTTGTHHGLCLHVGSELHLSNTAWRPMPSSLSCPSWPNPSSAVMPPKRPAGV